MFCRHLFEPLLILILQFLLWNNVGTILFLDFRYFHKFSESTPALSSVTVLPNASKHLNALWNPVSELGPKAKIGSLSHKEDSVVAAMIVSDEIPKGKGGEKGQVFEHLCV